MADDQVFSERYQLVRHLARGGMAQVYLAKDILLGRPVALKVLFPELSVDQAFVERFRREAQAAANLTHPNIVSVFDWGQGDRTYFIVMEYVDGQTLSQLIRGGSTAPPASRTGSRLTPERTAEIGAQVASALEFAHRHGVIHRDVKPGNVLIDEAGNVKVTDFGIARAIGTGEELTQTGAVMGTATYFSPEQAQGFAVDARSDVYALGVVLYEMAVGHPPFAGENPLSIAYQHVRQDPVPPTTQNHAVPPALEAIIMKAMAKAPEARYQTAEALRADLERFRRDQPVLAEEELAAQAATSVVSRTAVMGAVGAGAVAVGTRTGTAAPPGPPPAGYPAPYEPNGAPPGDTKRSRKGLWGALAAAAVVAAAVGLFFGGRSAGWWGTSAKTVAIPTDLIGKTAPAAENELRGLGFDKFAAAADPSRTIATGMVAGTRPNPGTRVRTDETITLLVSSGPGPVNVPDVIHQPASRATTTLEHAHFIVTSTEQASTTVNQGDVISTNPPAGHSAPYGSNVQLVVSSGAPEVSVPSLTGDDPLTAGSQLTGLGLRGDQRYEHSATIAAGQVTRTNPPAGTSVRVGTTVTVYVSLGPTQVTVPKDLVGATEGTAMAAINAVGLQPTVTTQPVSNPAQNGRVLSVSPPSGASEPQGSPVDLVVGAYTAPTTPPTTTPPTTAPPTTPSTTAPSPPTTKAGPPSTT